jgi:hypothetical protein
MKKSKEIVLFKNELMLNLENIDTIIDAYIKKIKKEYADIVLSEKLKLLIKIAEDEKLDLDAMKFKYLKNKELNSCNEVIKNTNTDELEDLLDKIELDNKVYYYDAKEKGKVYDENYKEVGYYKNSNVILNSI